METMRAVVLVTCILSLLSGIMDMLRPDERFQRQLRLILSAVFLLGILTPLAKGTIELSFNWDGNTTVSEDLTTAMMKQTETYAADNVEAVLTELLQEGGVTDASVQVEMHTTDESSIEINCVTVFCTDQDTAFVLLTEYLGEEVRIDVEEAL